MTKVMSIISDNTPNDIADIKSFFTNILNTSLAQIALDVIRRFRVFSFVIIVI
jgi:hypothetical protein